LKIFGNEAAANAEFLFCATQGDIGISAKRTSDGRPISAREPGMGSTQATATSVRHGQAELAPRSGLEGDA
jgi:hypothetical protein